MIPSRYPTVPGPIARDDFLSAQRRHRRAAQALHLSVVMAVPMVLLVPLMLYLMIAVTMLALVVGMIWVMIVLLPLHGLLS